LATIERPTDLAGFSPLEEGGESGGDEFRYLVAQAADQRVAIPLLSSREILTVKSVTRLPGAPSWIAGLVNVRGAVMTVLDLSVRLGAAGATGPVVIVELEGRRLGIRVDAVTGVERASAAEESVDAARSAAGAVRGLAMLAGGAALVVDVGALQRAAIADV
jgi:purine-binding chemotaxis protein CheW